MGKNTKKEGYKEYLRILAEQDELQVTKDNLGYVELEKPIHNGYISWFRLRDDVSRREDAGELASLVKDYTTIAWSRTKDFVSKKKKKVEVIEPKFIRVDEGTYLKFDEKKQKHFDRTYVNYYGGYRVAFILNIPKHYLEIGKKRDFITHRKVVDGDLESQIAFLADKIHMFYYTIYPFNSRVKLYAKVRNRTARRNDNVVTKKVVKDYREWSEYPHLEVLFSQKARHSGRWDSD